MKESSKESNKEEKQQEAHPGMEDSREDLRIDYDAFLRFFNETLRREKSSIPQCLNLSAGYCHRLQALVNEYNTKTVLMTAVRKMARSDFLNGRVKSKSWNKPFLASLIWLVHSDDNFAKVLNGYYDNPEDVKTAEELRLEAEAQRKAKAEEQRQEARRIEEEEREAKRRQREYDEAHRATPEELEKIFAEFKLPPLTKPDE